MTTDNIHGQVYDFEELFRVGSNVPKSNYLFMGDFMDCGSKVLRYASRSWSPGAPASLRSVCAKSLGDRMALLPEIFDSLSLWLSLMTRSFKCMGPLPFIQTQDQIQRIEKKHEVLHNGCTCDLFWSDLEDRIGWGVTPSEASCLLSVTCKQWHWR